MTIEILLVVLLVLILLLPYRWTRERTFGGLAGSWQSILYTYTYGPGYERVDFDGLHRLQRWFLFFITAVFGRVQPELIAWFIEILRRAIRL
jgi:hypothetical protein